MEGKNIRMNVASEEKRRMRKLEDRLDEAEEEIRKIKEIIGEKVKKE